MLAASSASSDIRFAANRSLSAPFVRVQVAADAAETTAEEGAAEPETPSVTHRRACYGHVMKGIDRLLQSVPAVVA
eukprot:1072552-Prorocentrum_minimum.AAC.1